MIYTKKQIERHHLEGFRTAFSYFPPGEIAPTEEPDFLIHADTGTIGIEITELYRKSTGKVPMQATESTREKILDRARTMYAERGCPIVRVSVRFGDLLGFPTSRIDEVADRIAALVADDVPDGYDSIEIENSWEDLERFPGELNGLQIRRLHGASRSQWSAPIAEFMPSVTITNIQGTIDEKNQRLASYRRQATEMWLLIVHSLPHRASSMFDIEEAVLMHRFVTEFDRIFLFNKFDGDVVELLKAQ